MRKLNLNGLNSKFLFSFFKSCVLFSAAVYVLALPALFIQGRVLAADLLVPVESVLCFVISGFLLVMFVFEVRKIFRFVKVPKFSVFIILMMFFLFFVPFVSASDQLLAFFNTTNSDSLALNAVHPASSGASAWGSTLIVSTDAYLTGIQFYLKISGSPSNVVLRSQVYEVDNYTALPSSASAVLIDESDNSVSSSVLSSSYAWVMFTFSQDVLLETGHTYSIFVYVDSATLIDSSNKIIVASMTGSTWSEVCQAYFNNAWFNQGTTTHTCYTVYGNLEVVSTPTPSPVPSATPYSGYWYWNGTHYVPVAGSNNYYYYWNGTHYVPLELRNSDSEVALSTFMSILVPLACILIPAFICLVVTKGNFFGFLAGLNAGAVLGYFVSAGSWIPMYGIIIVVVIDALVFVLGRS